jgi:glutathione peroxidase
MKKLTLIVLALMVGTILMNGQNSVHTFTVKDIDGNDFNLESLKGKKVMIVNTASKCGLTPQYEGLENLYKEFGGEKFTIIGFPANNFLSQEPGSNDEIKEFCSKNYGVSFPMMSKVSVKGDDQHELYQWLTSKKKNGVDDSKVKWNFQKYLINEKGELVKVLSPSTEPMDDEITTWIKG